MKVYSVSGPQLCLHVVIAGKAEKEQCMAPPFTN